MSPGVSRSSVATRRAHGGKIHGAPLRGAGVPFDLHGQLDAHALGPAAEIPGGHEGLDAIRRSDRQPAEVHADASRVAPDNLRRDLELAPIARQGSPEA